MSTHLTTDCAAPLIPPMALYWQSTITQPLRKLYTKRRVLF